MQTFEAQIAANKRKSMFLIAVIIALMGVLTGVFTVAITRIPLDLAHDAFMFGVTVGASIAVLCSLGSWYFGDKLLRGISNARQVEYFHDPILCNVVEEMAIAAGIPVPKIYAIVDESPNAFASGRDPTHAMIAITTGLRKQLERDELQAVVAHEIAHIRNYDTRMMMLVGVFAGCIVFMADTFRRMLLDSISITGHRGGVNHRTVTRPHRMSTMIIVLVGTILFAWCAPIIAKLLQLAISREREYLADATAVRYCRNPLALASALKKIAMDPIPMLSPNRATEHLFIMNPNPERKLQAANEDSIWSTHPPVIKRIARLRAMAGEYPQPEQVPEEEEPDLTPSFDTSIIEFDSVTY